MRAAGAGGGKLSIRTVLLAGVALAAPSLVHAQSQTTAPSSPQPAAKPAAEAPKPADKATTVDNVTVQGDRNATTTAIDRRSYSVANDLQATTGSISDALRGVPGVQVDVQGNVSMRGSGVTILVDGKPSTLFSGEGQADALQNMPADQIERVEVMTNPSAEFSPEGRGGVINLVMKRTRRQVGTVTVRANAGTDGRWNGGLSGSLMNGPLTVSGSAGVRRNTGAFDYEAERSRLDILGGVFLDSRDAARTDNDNISGQARLGADYDLDPKSRLSGELRYSRSDSRSRSRAHYEGEDAAGTIDNAFDRSSESDSTWGSAGATLRWRRQFEGEEHDLTLALLQDRQWADSDTEAVTDFTLPVTAPLYERIGIASVTDTTRLTADYNRPLPGNQWLKLGTEFRFHAKDFDFRGERGAAPGATLPDPALTNRFLYELDTQAVYFTYQRPIGPVTAQFGLRLEAEQMDIDQRTSGVRADNNDAALYPTLHLQYELNDDQKLTASYSRRIQRPGPGELNPYVIYVDPFNRRSGNSDLRPAITDSFEAGWEYRSGQTFVLASVYFHDNRDGVTDVTRDIGGGIFLTRRENLTTSRDGGIEASASGKLFEGLTYQLFGDVHWNQIDGSSLVAGGDRSGVTWFTSATLNWQVTPDDFVQVQGFAWGDQLTPQGSREGAGAVNLGYRHKFNEDVSLVFTAQDVFGTLGRWVQLVDTPLLRTRIESEFPSRTFYLGLTWTFGNGSRRQPERFEFDSAGGAPPG